MSARAPTDPVPMKARQVVLAIALAVVVLPAAAEESVAEDERVVMDAASPVVAAPASVVVADEGDVVADGVAGTDDEGVGAAIAPDSRSTPEPNPLAEARPVFVAMDKAALQAATSGEGGQFDLDRAFESFLRLMRARDHDAAGKVVDRIADTLGADHLVALRARAYHALNAGDTQLARGQYRRILDVLPDDREAGMNLAVLEWRSGEAEVARKRIGDVLAMHPEDAQARLLARTMAEARP